MVSEPWSATLRATPTASQKRTRFIGHYPGFKAAKARANQAAQQLQANRALRAVSPSSTGTLPATTTGAVVFDGPSESDTLEIPPDSQIAAGPTQLVVVVNSLVAIYDKTGALQGSFQQLSSFFSSLGLNGEFFDPRIIYDQTDGRFILSADELDLSNFSNGHVLLAVSQTSDATGGWNKYALDFMGRNLANTANTFPDFPTLGLSSTAVYISTAQFEMSSTCLAADTCSFSDTWIKVIGLPELLAGSSSLNVTTFKNVTTPTGFPAFAIEPALTYGSAPAEFLVAADFSANPGTTLNVFTISTSGTPVLSEAGLSVTKFLIPPDAVQQGSGMPVATNDFRLLNAVWVNNSLWCGQNTADANGGTSAVARWYEINASSLSSISLSQWGQVAGSGYAYYPALSVDSSGDTGMVFTTSSTNQYPSGAFTGRSAADAANTMRTYELFRQGTGYYQDVALRWGDYNGISLDPTGSSFWVIAEYASTPNPNYGTAIAEATSLPALSPSTSLINFGPETVNIPSAPQTVTITNQAAASATLGPVSISGLNPGDFSIPSDGCSGVTLAPAGTCSVSLVFTPTEIGNREATLLLSAGPDGFPQAVYLVGQGLTPTSAISVSPTTLTFPPTAVGTFSAPQVVQVTNIGTGPVTVVINLESTSVFSQTNNCGASLSPGATCSINVTYAPRYVYSGGDYDVMTVLYQGFPAGATFPEVFLGGTAFNAPLVNLCPTSLTFPAQAVGTTSPPQIVIVNNSGTATLTVSAIQVSGDFSLSSACGALPFTLSSHTACNLQVTFTPPATGTRTGSLTITDNATGSPHIASLTGTGVSLTADRLLPQEVKRAATQRLSPPSRSGRHAQLEAGPAFGKLPLAFERNDGETDPRVSFLARGPGYTLFLTRDGAVLRLEKNQGAQTRARLNKARGFLSPRVSSLPPAPRLPTRTSTLSMSLVGAQVEAQAQGIDRLPGQTNYLKGPDPEKWRTNVPVYRRVRYSNVYPGIDLVFYGRQRQLEYDFVVAPGADPQAIELGIETQDPKLGSHDSMLRIDVHGNLVIGTADGDVIFHKPVVYQPRDGAAGSGDSELGTQNSELLDARYVLTAQSRVKFKIPAYDRTRPLVIDPVLSYSTFLGGTGGDAAYGLALDSSGNVYITGSTGSANFPLSNPLQSSINRTLAYDTDAFVAKLSPGGTSLVYSTYLGGTRSETGYAIAVDSQGNAYIGGMTSSSDFPVTSGAFQTTSQSSLSFGGHGFVAKLNASGSGLVYSTYFGGSGQDQISALALDSNGDAYIAGGTSSTDFPTTSGVLQPVYPGSTTGNGKGFVAELNPQGSALVYSTYLGGSGSETATGIAVDSTGSATVTGSTWSNDFPTTPGAYQIVNLCGGGRLHRFYFQAPAGWNGVCLFDIPWSHEPRLQRPLRSFARRDCRRQPGVRVHRGVNHLDKLPDGQSISDPVRPFRDRRGL